MTSLEWLQNNWLNAADVIGNIIVEQQNADYEGQVFTVNNQTFRSRLAKKTPKKQGYFVVFWEKDAENKNQAYAFSEAPDQLLVLIVDDEKQGLFIFPKSVLLTQGILSNETSKGKMGMRVYPTWETELNRSAERTQKWQALYFTDYSNQ